MNYVSYKLDEDTTVHFEVEPSEGLKPTTSLREAAEWGQQSFGKAVESAVRSMELVLKILRNCIPEPPAEIEITFGLKAAAEAGVWAFSKASAEGNYGVKLVWKDKTQPALR